MSPDIQLISVLIQVAWAKTKRIGCGIAHCPNAGFAYYVVCEYYPGGNYRGVYPYVSSTESCTTCAAMGYQCGEYKDSCGNKITCNSCKVNETCKNHMCIDPSSGSIALSASTALLFAIAIALALF